MQYSVTWDLLIIIFFVVIVSYSYIVGQNGTLKIIISSYISMLAANGLGNLFEYYIQFSQPLIKIVETSGAENVMLIKIISFIALTLILVLKGSFVVELGYHRSLFIRIGIVTSFGFLSAGLIMSTILVFMAGGRMDSLFTSALQQGIDLPIQTMFIKSLIQYYNIWFVAPAIAFVTLSLFQTQSSPSNADQA